MHRELTYAEQAFEVGSNLTLYLLTGLIGLILAADLWPLFATWEPLQTWGLPTWPREFGNYRLALLAAILGGARTLYGALNSLLEGRLGADLALALAVIAAVLVGEPLVAAEVVFVGLVGECLEAITFERTQREVRKLAELFPRRCWLLREGQEVRVLVDEVQIGDRVLVKPGGKVPVDGIIVEGRSPVDMAALTGESLPVDKGPGDEILAGVLTTTGALTIEARRVREQTVAGRVIEMTARALRDKAPVERTADRLARLFLPAVLVLALLTLLAGLLYYGTNLFRGAEAPRLGTWETLRRSMYPTLSVLVVACPCALILATPAAILAALGRLAGTGILIKGGAALERLAGVNTFAFDKTGTLTEGRLELGEVVVAAMRGENEILRLAAAVEARSEHPMARMVVRAAQQRGLTWPPVEEFLASPGSGVSGWVEGERVLVGTPRWIVEQGISLSADLSEMLSRLDAEGQTALVVASAGQVIGMLGARDRVRPEARATLAELKTLGIDEILLLTGDRDAVARTVGGELDLGEVRGGLLPQQKAEAVANRRAAGRRVAMVGDGINDAPALAGADVGLAVAGIEAVAEAGDIVFMGDPLRHLPLLLRLSRQTVRIIRQNILIFAFGVNAVGIVVTAWLWPLFAPSGWSQHGPLAAVVYHQLGSLAVLINAMRLLWFERQAMSPGWQRWRSRAEAFNAWTERTLNAHEIFDALVERWRFVLGALGGILLAALVLSGWTQIERDEIGLVKRFGYVLDKDLTPGLHYRWPWPIETVVRIRPEEIHSLTIGFRFVPGATETPGTLTWSSAHGADGVRRIPEEGVMLTGDGNLVEVQATLRYQVAHPRTYLYEINDPENTLRSAAEAVLRETVAGRPFANLLTSQRAEYTAEVLRRLEERCQGHGPQGLGVRLEGIALHDIHPPQEVVEAYYAVTQAMEGRDRQTHQARAETLFNPRVLGQSVQLWRQAEQDGSRSGLSLSEAQALATQAVRQAEAARLEIIESAGALRDVFAAKRAARTALPWSEEIRLLREAIGMVTPGRDAQSVVESYRRRRASLQAIRAALTDFRTYWDTLGKALSGRDKMVIDAETLPGRRQLLLMDPDQFRLPLPSVTPSERPLPRSGREPERP